MPAAKMEDIMYREQDGSFLVLTDEEQLLLYKPVAAEDGMLTMVLRVSNPHLDHLPTGPVAARYLVTSSSGKNLLMVRRLQAPRHAGRKFEIAHRQGRRFGPTKDDDDLEVETSYWEVHLVDIENQVLFVGRCASRAMETGITGRVFFVDDEDYGMDTFDSDDTGLYICSLNKTVRILPRREQPGSSSWTWWLHDSSSSSGKSDTAEQPRSSPWLHDSSSGKSDTVERLISSRPTPLRTFSEVIAILGFFGLLVSFIHSNRKS